MGERAGVVVGDLGRWLASTCRFVWGEAMRGVAVGELLDVDVPPARGVLEVEGAGDFEPVGPAWSSRLASASK